MHPCGSRLSRTHSLTVSGWSPRISLITIALSRAWFRVLPRGISGPCSKDRGRNGSRSAGLRAFVHPCLHLVHELQERVFSFCSAFGARGGENHAFSVFFGGCNYGFIEVKRDREVEFLRAHLGLFSSLPHHNAFSCFLLVPIVSRFTARGPGWRCSSDLQTRSTDRGDRCRSR